MTWIDGKGMTVQIPANWSNWAGNQHCVASSVSYPDTPQTVSSIIVDAARDGRTVKAVGSGHSFSSIAVTGGIRLHLDQLSGLISVDRTERLATFGAGTPLHQVNQELAALGLAMPNLGDIDQQTISGALATGTHGTGGRIGCLATFVHALTLVTGTGEILRCSATEHPDEFAAARVGIGAVGVVTDVTLRCCDAFVLRAEERPVPLVDVFSQLDELVDGNDHFEFFWFPYTDRALTKTNNRVPADAAPLSRFRRWFDDELIPNRFFGTVCRVGRGVPGTVPTINRISARALSTRTYTAPSADVFCTPRRVGFVEMEYSVPRAALPDLFNGLRRVLTGLPFKVIFPAEVRFSAADDIWLSHGHGRDNAYLAIHQYVGMPYEPYFRAVEQVATALDGRPHWGKVHYRDADTLGPAYPRFADFRAVRDRLDPARVFRNAYLDRVLGT